MSRYVIGALTALGSFDRPWRSDDEEADGKGHGGKQNSNKEEVVGKRMHADLQSAAPRATNVPPYRIGCFQEMAVFSRFGENRRP